MYHYKYVDTIRKPSGELRCWEEYEQLRYIEYLGDIESVSIDFEHKHKLIDKENENRSRIQKHI